MFLKCSDCILLWLLKSISLVDHDNDYDSDVCNDSDGDICYQTHRDSDNHNNNYNDNDMYRMFTVHIVRIKSEQTYSTETKNNAQDKEDVK